MERLKKGLAGRLGDIALIAGAALTAAGAGMIYLPAGLITAGVMLMVGAVLGAGDGS